MSNRAHNRACLHKFHVEPCQASSHKSDHAQRSLNGFDAKMAWEAGGHEGRPAWAMSDIGANGSSHESHHDHAQTVAPTVRNAKKAKANTVR